MNARRTFSSRLRYRNSSHDAGAISWIAFLRADVVFGWRQLNKHKVISVAAIFSLGLAMGACTAAFQLVDALFLRPLPISHPQRLYVVSRPGAGFGDGWEHMRFRRMRAAMKDQADLIAASFPERTDVTYGLDREPTSGEEKAYVQYVSGWMFRSFGIRPSLGRLLTEGDDLEPGAHPVAVLSYDYWTHRFGRNANAVGSTITIARRYGMGSDVFDIIGVANKGFTGTEPGTETQIFVPAMMHPLVNLPMASLFRIFVLLPPSISPEPVREHLDAVLHALNREDGKRFAYRQDDKLSMDSAGSGISELQKHYSKSLVALGVLVALVLSIACANIANLTSAQAMARSHEMALRVAIGAGRARLIQLVLVGSTMLALTAAAVGATVASWAAPFVVARINPPDSPAYLSLAFDGRVLAFASALTVLVTLFVGLAPALRASAVHPFSVLQGGDNQRSRTRLMHVLIAVQTCFCFLVLFVSGLFVTTFDRLAHQRTGFPVHGLLALDTVTPRDESPAAWNQVAEHLRSIPGVEDTAVSEWPLLDGNSYRLNHISIEGAPAEPAAVRFLVVSSGWIETMKIPMLQGRDFRPDETEAAIVNQEFVHKFLSSKNPLGKWVEAKPGGAWGHRFQIAGVAADTRYRTVRDPILPVVYIPNQTSWHARTLMVRGLPSKNLANPLAIASILRQEVSRARPGFRVTRIRTQQAMLQAQMVRERLLAALALFFSAVALLLAGVGLYGVLDHSVFQRRREIGIRMAIGAQTRNIAERIILDVIGWVVAGSLVGLVFGLGVARFIGSLLYQVTPTGFDALVTPALAFIAMAAFAALRPVLRAVRTDPARILRSQ